jgi:ATP-dependent DNA helicase RecQ
MTTSTALHELLEKHWGYTAFRPKQEAIVQAILAGRDAAVVMPTGGGKSLCYQLPAVAMGKTCVVISPLIALMQDQAASLREMGIDAAFFNSTLNYAQQQEVKRSAALGHLQLLYLSPERAVRADVLEWLRTVPVGFFAIDEAHCISEWGHEFRPEYRQLRILREQFPETPIAAFTASATRQVRHDILAQLSLRDPAKIVMSFHRPNLRYIVRECGPGEQERLLQAAVDWYDEGNVIVYAPTIREVEAIAARLSVRGIAAVPYHGQMDAKTRQANQEQWMSGEQRVLVGTIAFGLGINKPDVRAVVHLSMPKSLEQYYQEAGRSGRDGEPADCVLLWQKRDVGLLTHFIQETQDPAERERAWQRYHTIRRFVDHQRCRHRQICLHFGETPKWETCGACDNCGTSLEWMTLSEAPVVATDRAVVRRRVARSGEIPVVAPVDAAVRDALRKWRREQAQQQSVPAYVILHDTTVDALARIKPRSLASLRQIPGIGEKKAERYGAALLEMIAGQVPGLPHL